MTCEHCEELKERIAWLESELGLQRDFDALKKIHGEMKGSTPNPKWSVARMLLAMYAAKGRPMSRAQMLEASPPRSRGEDDRAFSLTSVWVCKAREIFGREIIENVWGVGYRLTPVGMAKIAAILGDAP